MATSVNIVDEIKKYERRLKFPEEVLGKELAEPIPTAVSGSRKLLYSTQADQVMSLNTPEVPFLQTGYENEFGHKSTSFKQYKGDDLVILDKVDKFNWIPNHHYFLLTYNANKNIIDVVERCSYLHITESYGYDQNTKYLDSLGIGSKIRTGDIYLKSKGFDECNNRMDGVNLLVTYAAISDTTEDAIVLSESCAKRLSSPLYHKVQIMVNENDIMLNLYGNETIYKVMPDIGEEVSNSLLLATRRENKQESLFSQVYSRLMDINMNDNKITATGTVVDVNVITNNPEMMEASNYTTQLRTYWKESIRFSQELVDKVDMYKDRYPNAKIGYELQVLYSRAKSLLDGEKFSLDGKKAFSNIFLEVVVRENNELHIGDKITNRYGGKGVISRILPDEEMFETIDGRRVEMIYNQGTSTNRLNPAQIFETEINAASAKLLRYLPMDTPYEVNQSLERIATFMSIFTLMQANAFREYIYALNDDSKLELLKSMKNDGCIILSVSPIQENIDLDKLVAMYELFPECEIDYAYCQLLDSNGNPRKVRTQRPLLVGHQYIVRLKQYAEDKFSVTSLSATNSRNENSRNKNPGEGGHRFPNTPVRWGVMETSAMQHIGSWFNAIMLLVYSTSPHARRKAKNLLTDSPFNIDVKVDSESKSRSVEVLNVYLRTIGLRIRFDKYKKVIKSIFALPSSIPSMFIKVPDADRKPTIEMVDDKKGFKIPQIIFKGDDPKPNMFINPPKEEEEPQKE